MTDTTLKIANYVKNLQEKLSSHQDDINKFFENNSNKLFIRYGNSNYSETFNPVGVFNHIIPASKLKCLEEDVIKMGDIELTVKELRELEKECANIMERLGEINEMFLNNFFQKMNDKLEKLKESL